MNRPEQSPVDLDFVEDPTASVQDRDDDAALAALVRTRLTALELPPSRVDVGAAARGADDLGRARTRRRAAWVVAGAVAAAAAVVAVVVLGGGLGRPAQRQGPVASEGGGGTSAVPLRAGVPELPADEVQRLEALADPQPVGRGKYWPTISASVTPVACSTTESEIGHTPGPAVLDGLDTSGLRQECATTSGVAGRLVENGTEEFTFLYRFYLPQDITLDDVTWDDATERGVSWTETQADGPPVPIFDETSPGLASVTSIRWLDATARVDRQGPTQTGVAWVEPGAWADQNGSYDVAVRAVVAADPVTAVRAAVGFRNQGGMQVVRGDDGSLLLVPTSPPREGMEALTSGALTRTDEGCVGIAQGESGFRLVLWPFGTTWDATARELVVPGEGEFRLGQRVDLGGGESGGRYTAALVPEGCGQGKVWIASSVRQPPQDEVPRGSSPASTSDAVGPWGDTDLPLTAETLAADAYFVMRPPAEGLGEMQAVVGGTLAVLRGGCLGIAPDTAVIWPAGTTALPDGSGVRLSDGQVLRVGELLDGGGGLSDIQLSGRASECPGHQAAYLNDPPLR